MHTYDTAYQGIRGQYRAGLLPNLLTTFRLLSPAVIIPFAHYDFPRVALAFIVLAAISDLEGLVARRTNTETKFGAIFDPIADKIFSNLVLVFAISSQHWYVLPLWLVMFLYDVDQTLQRGPDMHRACRNLEGKPATPATLISKGKTCLVFGVIFLVYLPVEIFSKLPWWLVPTLAALTITSIGWSWSRNRKSALLWLWQWMLRKVNKTMS